jgi:hypothetical protein
MVWTELIWLRIGTGALVNAVMNLRVPLSGGKLLNGCRTGRR